MRVLFMISLFALTISCNQKVSEEQGSNEVASIGTAEQTANTIDSEGGAEGNSGLQDISTDFPVFTPSVSFHDFGIISDAAPVEYTFKFQNTGKAPLIISHAKSSCGCTVPSFPKDPVKPGESGEILVKFDPEGKKGQVAEKTITLTTNTRNGVEKLNIKADIK